MQKSIIFKKQYVIAGIGALIVGGAIGSFTSHNGNGLETIAVTRGTIAQTVLITGKTKPKEEVKLAFEKGGKVKNVYVHVGDKVAAGKTLAELDTQGLLASRLEAQANLEAEQAKLDELRRGTRLEEIKIQEVKVTNAETALDDAKRNLIDKIQNAYAKSDDAIRSKVDQLFSSSGSTNTQVNILGFANKHDVENGRVAVEQILRSWHAAIALLTPETDLAPALTHTTGNLALIKQFLDVIAVGVNTLGANTSLSQATIDGYRTDISSARTNVNAGVTNLVATNEGFRTAQSNLTLEQNQLALKNAGATKEQIAAQDAKVKQAHAGLGSANAELSKAILRAPIAGIVTLQDAKAGEIVGANTPIISIISEGNLEIEANIPEVDVGRTAVGNPVSITLDALSDEAFSGSITFIDPAETIIDGVVNFKVKVAFEKNDPRMKSGLTSNLSITTLHKDNALILPQSAIIKKEAGSFVRKINGKVFEEVSVTVGAQSADGSVEILSGVNEGDAVEKIASSASGTK